MAIHRLFILFLLLNLVVPTLAISFMGTEDEEVVCELLEDLNEEEEEDGKESVDKEGKFMVNDLVSGIGLMEPTEYLHRDHYQENCCSLQRIEQEVTTPPPRIA